MRMDIADRNVKKQDWLEEAVVEKVQRKGRTSKADPDRAA